MISPRSLAVAHAAYYVATGGWAVAHRASFERVTGPKRDYWLVRLVGGLAVATGASLGAAVLTRRKTPETVVLATATSLAFVVADGYAARALSRVYLGDPLVHAVLLPAWFRRWG